MSIPHSSDTENTHHSPMVDGMQAAEPQLRKRQHIARFIRRKTHASRPKVLSTLCWNGVTAFKTSRASSDARGTTPRSLASVPSSASAACANPASIAVSRLRAS
jgi:hypothetical protein